MVEKKYLRKLIIVTLATCFISCYPSKPFENFTFFNRKNSGIKLKTKGYYYTSSEELGLRVIILYDNNTYAQTTGIIDLKTFEKRLINKENLNWHFWWGIYFVEQNRLQSQQFINNPYGDYRVWEDHFTILNDTTFRFDQSFIRLSPNEMIENERNSRIYKFRPFNTLPPKSENWVAAELEQYLKENE